MIFYKFVNVCCAVLLLIAPCSIFAATPSAYYKFNENSYNGTAGEVKDSSANDRHGKTVGGPQPVVGKVCNAIDLSAAGGSDYANLNKNILDGIEVFSIAVWVKTSADQYHSVLNGYRPTSYQDLLMRFVNINDNGTTLQYFYRNSAPTSIGNKDIVANQWHHLVWTHRVNASCMYIDAELQDCYATVAGPLSLTYLRLGSYVQNPANGPFDGLIDELAIFESELTQAEVTTIYNNGNDGNNVDGSDPGYCGGSAPAAVLHYEMDEKSWAGNVGEVKDEINNLHATSVGGAKTADSTRAITGDPGTCGYGVFDGVDDYISVADNNQLDLPALTISAWINPTELPTLDLQGIVSKGSNYEFNLTVGGGLQFWSEMTNAITAPAGSISAGQWTHVAVTVKSAKQVLYINGVAQTTATITGNLPSNAIDIRIGADDIGYLRYFKGYIDEVKIFDNAMTAADVLALKNKTHPCPVAAAEAAGYHLEDPEWSNSAGQVKDYISNHDGRPFNNLAMLDPTPALTGDPGTCAYGDFNGSNQYIRIPKSNLNVDGSFSVSFWAKTKGSPNSYRAGVGSRSVTTRVDGKRDRKGFSVYAGANQKWTFTTGIADGYLNLDRLEGPAVVADTWTHIAVTFESTSTSEGVHTGTKTLYVNGVATSVFNKKYAKNTTANIAVGAIMENSAVNHFFNGLLDEVHFYNGALNQQQVDTIRAQTHPCPAEISAGYHFEDGSWNGSAGEVKDYVGNVDGQAKANEKPVIAKNGANAITGDPGTCDYGVFDADKSQYLQMPSSDKLNVDGSYSVAVWVKSTGNNSNYPGVVTSRSSSGGFALHSSFYEGTPGNPNRIWYFTTRNSAGGQSNTYGGSVIDDEWTHVAITFQAIGGKDANGDYTGAKKLYVDGVLVGSDASQKYAPNPVGDVAIGAIINNGNVSEHFTGSIDEAQFYTGALTQDQVDYIKAQTHPCQTLDHFNISHSGVGLTCESETVTIQACRDSSCANLMSDSVTLNLKTTNPSSVVSTHAIPAFTASTTYDLNHTTAETLTLSIDGESITPSNTYTCNGSTAPSADCNLTFADAGFRFIYGDSISPAVTTIPYQTSGVYFPQALKLQAVKSNAGVCEGIFNGNVKLSLAQGNVTPSGADNYGLPFQIKATNTNIAKYGNYTNNVKLNFGSDSVATIDFPRYLDAGKIRLYAKYQSAGVSLIGISNNFWVKPSAFTLSATKVLGGAALNGNTSTSSVKHVAGEDFSFIVKAINSLNQVVENYQQADGKLQLSVKRLLPTSSGTVDGDLTYSLVNGAVKKQSSAIATTFSDATLNSFIVSGARGTSEFAQAKYAEVGVIEVDVQDANYGFINGSDSAGLVSGAAITIGRFIPDHFVVIFAAQGTLINENNPLGDFVYTGERKTTALTQGAISYGIQPSVLITSNNKNGDITHNYTGDFMKLATANISAVAPTTDATMSGAANTLMDLAADINTGTLTDNGPVLGAVSGTVLYTYNHTDNYVYTRDANSLINGYRADVDLRINSIVDADGVVTQDSDGTGVNDPAGIITLNPTGLLIRFGRWNIENTYGPETSDLPLPMSLQFWNGSRFITNTDDDLTPYDGATVANTTKSNSNLSPALATNLVTVSDYRASSSAVPTFVDGIGRLRLSAPGAGNRGQVKIVYATAPTWLLYDWDNNDSANDGPYDDNPSGVATFGVYRGNDRVISWREISAPQ